MGDAHVLNTLLVDHSRSFRSICIRSRNLRIVTEVKVKPRY